MAKTGLYAEILKGGANLGYLKRGGGAQLQAASGGAPEDNVVPHSKKKQKLKHLAKLATKIKTNFCSMFILAEHFPLDIHDNCKLIIICEIY